MPFLRFKQNYMTKKENWKWKLNLFHLIWYSSLRFQLITFYFIVGTFLHYLNWEKDLLWAGLSEMLPKSPLHITWALTDLSGQSSVHHLFALAGLRPSFTWGLTGFIPLMVFFGWWLWSGLAKPAAWKGCCCFPLSRSFVFASLSVPSLKDMISITWQWRATSSIFPAGRWHGPAHTNSTWKKVNWSTHYTSFVTLALSWRLRCYKPAILQKTDSEQLLVA